MCAVCVAVTLCATPRADYTSITPRALAILPCPQTHFDSNSGSSLPAGHAGAQAAAAAAAARSPHRMLCQLYVSMAAINNPTRSMKVYDETAGSWGGGSKGASSKLQERACQRPCTPCPHLTGLQ